jgi:putative flippase GtrA
LPGFTVQGIDRDSFGRFLVVGTITAAVTYLVFLGALHLGLHYSVSCTLAWAIASILSYLMNSGFTFRATGIANIAVILKFALGNVLQLIIGIAGYFVLIDLFHFGWTAAYLLNTVSTTTFSYLFMALAVFQNNRLQIGGEK